MSYLKNAGRGALLSASIAIGATTSTSAATVDLELLLLSDSSGSISAGDFELYIDGYEAAFRDAGVIDQIVSGAIGSIAVSLAFFSGAGQQVQSIGWTEISDAASANLFADAIAALNRPYSGSTGISSGLTFGAGTFSNGFEGTRNVIDIVIDGSENNACNSRDAFCDPLQNARDAALAGEVDTINALVIEDDPLFGDDATDQIQAVPYAQNNIIGGAGAFASLIGGFDEFEGAIATKLIREIAPPPPMPSAVPVPASLPLLLGGFALLGVVRRRAKS